MLSQLLELFSNNERGLSLSEISREMKVQSSAILPMLDLLVKKEKLVEVGPDGMICAACGSESDCNLLAARGKRYILASSLEDKEHRLNLPSA